MNFNDYILEAAGVSDVDIMDIEVSQAMAEMAVLEAMMDCYEKQMVLLEYNEDSADEIFTEAETFLPEIGDWVVEYKQAQMNREGKKYIVEVIDGKWVNGSWIPRIGEQNRKLVGTYDTEEEAKAALNKENARLKKAQNTNFGDARRHEEKAKRKAAKDARDAVRRRKWELKQKFGENSDKQDDGSSGTTATPGSNATASSESPKEASQWDGSKEVSSASKSFKNSFKKFMSKAGSVMQQLVLGLIDNITAVNFAKLGEKINEKGSGFTMNEKQFNTLHRLEDLMDLTQVYYGKADIELLSRKTWTRAEVNRFKVEVFDYFKNELHKKYADTGIYNDTKEMVNAENKQVTVDQLVDLCNALGRNEFKKLLRKCQKEAAAYNTDFNENANIPPEIGKGMRDFVKELIKVYNKTTKDFKIMLNWALEVGAAQDKRNRQGGIDQSPIGFKNTAKAKELNEQRKAARKMNQKARLAEWQMRQNGEEAAWAEEGWSMNLDEDENFF